MIVFIYPFCWSGSCLLVGGHLSSIRPQMYVQWHFSYSATHLWDLSVLYCNHQWHSDCWHSHSTTPTSLSILARAIHSISSPDSPTLSYLIYAIAVHLITSHILSLEVLCFFLILTSSFSILSIHFAHVGTWHFLAHLLPWSNRTEILIIPAHALQQPSLHSLHPAHFIALLILYEEPQPGCRHLGVRFVTYSV